MKYGRPLTVIVKCCMEAFSRTVGLYLFSRWVWLGEAGNHEAGFAQLLGVELQRPEPCGVGHGDVRPSTYKACSMLQVSAKPGGQAVGSVFTVTSRVLTASQESWQHPGPSRPRL